MPDRLRPRLHFPPARREKCQRGSWTHLLLTPPPYLNEKKPGPEARSIVTGPPRAATRGRAGDDSHGGEFHVVGERAAPISEHTGDRVHGPDRRRDRPPPPRRGGAGQGVR